MSGKSEMFSEATQSPMEPITQGSKVLPPGHKYIGLCALVIKAHYPIYLCPGQPPLFDQATSETISDFTDRKK